MTKTIPDDMYQLNNWIEQEEFAAIYAEDGKYVDQIVKNWKDEGRCMRLETTAKGTRYLVGDDTGHFNILLVRPGGAHWMFSTGVTSTRIGYAISGIMPAS